jgi:hypothetical protein
MIRILPFDSPTRILFGKQEGNAANCRGSCVQGFEGKLTVRGARRIIDRYRMEMLRDRES